MLLVQYTLHSFHSKQSEGMIKRKSSLRHSSGRLAVCNVTPLSLRVAVVFVIRTETLNTRHAVCPVAYVRVPPPQQRVVLFRPFSWHSVRRTCRVWSTSRDIDEIHAVIDALKSFAKNKNRSHNVYVTAGSCTQISNFLMLFLSYEMSRHNCMIVPEDRQTVRV